MDIFPIYRFNPLCLLPTGSRIFPLSLRHFKNWAAGRSVEVFIFGHVVPAIALNIIILLLHILPDLCPILHFLPQVLLLPHHSPQSLPVGLNSWLSSSIPLSMVKFYMQWLFCRCILQEIHDRWFLWWFWKKHIYRKKYIAGDVSVSITHNRINCLGHIEALNIPVTG